MSDQVGSVVTDRSLRARLGGRWAISLPPYLWSTPFVVFLLPLASSDEYSTVQGLLQIILIAAIAWLVFGLVLFVGHKTYFRHRAQHPVSPIATIILAATGGVAQSLVHGDWFSIFGLYGYHSYSKVINAGIGSIAWVTISANFMYSKYSFIEMRDRLLAEHQLLLKESEQWLHEVRSHRNALAEQMRDKLQSDWDRIRSGIRERLEAQPTNWRTALDDLLLTSRETALSLTESFNRSQMNNSSFKDAVQLIASIPLMEVRGAILLLATIGALPLTRLAGFIGAILIVLISSLILIVINKIGTYLIQRRKNQAIIIFTSATFLIALAPVASMPVLIRQGLEPLTSFALTLSGGVAISTTFVVHNLSILNRQLRANQLQSLQTQNILLQSIESMQQQVEFEARVDLAGYLNATINGAVKQATDAIALGIASGDLTAVNSGLAVIDAVYSNILGRYTSEEEIDFRSELVALAQPWSNQAIITWGIEAIGLDREVSRRALLIAAQVFSDLIPTHVATRVHIDVNGAMSHAELLIECNANKDWIESAQLTREVLNASTNSWAITGNLSQSRLEATIG